MSTHANMSGTDLHEDKRIKQDVRAASTANVSLSAPGSTLDGVTLVAGDRVLLKDQTTASQNGIYTWSTATSVLVRASDASTAALLFYGFKLFVREGTANAATYWTFTQTATVTLETTSLTFAKDGAGSGTVTSVAVTVPSDLSVGGSPITTSGTIAITAANQSANTVKAGPSSGAAAAPGYRTLVPADLPTMVASGASHAGGAVPDPGGTAGTTRFLREDATFAVPAGGGSGGVAGAPSNLISETVLSAAAASITVSSIPQGYRDLRVIVEARGDTAAAFTQLNLQFNGDTAANYDWQRTDNLSNGNNVNFSAAQTSGACGYASASTATTGVAGASVIDILDYAGTSFQKTWLARAFSGGSATSATSFMNNLMGKWRSTSAITSITLIPAAGNFVSGTVVRVYGEPVANQSSSAAATASSGTISTAGLTISRVSPAGAVTGVILQAGTAIGQQCNVINEAVAANSVTFAASGTSNVADGTSDVIAGLTARLFVWDTGTSLWYRCA